MRQVIIVFFVLLLGSYGLQAQDQLIRDLKALGKSMPKTVPKPVREILVEYVNILRTSKDLDECAERFTAIAGGTLVNEDGQSLRNTVAPFSLKKDFNNVQHYANPIRITRVDVTNTNGTGYGESAIRGKHYKIWIDKINKSTGMPAPISIVVPQGHPTIKTPKVVGIGSL